MTLRDLLDAGIDFQSEVLFQQYDYTKDELIVLTEEEAMDEDIRYIYPLGDHALVVEVEGIWDE